MQHYTFSFLLYLFITLMIESFVVFLLLRKILKIGKQTTSIKEMLPVTIFASSMTLPYVWFVFPNLFSNFVTAIWLSEVCVLVVEAMFYKIYLKLSLKNAFLISLIANVVSFGLGKLLHNLFGN